MRVFRAVLTATVQSADGGELMHDGTPRFSKNIGLGAFKVFNDEVRYDPIVGSPGAKHWAIPLGALRDVTYGRKFMVYSLSFHIDAKAYELFGFTSDEVLRIMPLVMPQKLESDPSLADLQRRQTEDVAKAAVRREEDAAKAAARREQANQKQAQQAYERQLDAYHKSLQPEQMVRTYRKNPEKEFQKEATHLAREGWTVQSQTAGGLKREGVVSMVTLGVGGKRKVGEMTAVFTRQPRPLPMPTPPLRSTPQPTPKEPVQRPQTMMQPQPMWDSQTQIPRASEAPQNGGPEQPDPMTQLERLGELHTKGILTDEEFSTKKADILSRL